MSEWNIAPMGSTSGPQPAAGIKNQLAAPPAGFGQWLSQSLSEVNQLQQASESASQKLITGESNDIHGTMIAMQKSGIAVDLVMEIRNKVIAAYDEVKRMQF